VEFAEHPRPRPRLSIAPLIDVVFLLLVFFMLASSFAETATIDLSVSQGQAAAAAEPGLVVAIDGAGAITVNGAAVALDGVGQALAERAGAERARPVTLRAEAAVPARTLVGVMDRIRGAGFENLRLATPDGA